ncbi:MAG: sensor histidine kinase/response rgulator [Myxococcales bacterium]|nr:sensor histidine kinase/response rgulator [Myxococcales bacterium]
MASPHHVLLVDDEPAVLIALQLAFEDSPGFEVFTATSAEEALAVARKERLDLVITDKNLADASGIELARRLQESHPGLAVILITGYANAPSREDGRALGLAAYVEKPFNDIYDIPRLARDILGREVAHA